MPRVDDSVAGDMPAREREKVFLTFLLRRSTRKRRSSVTRLLLLGLLSRVILAFLGPHLVTFRGTVSLLLALVGRRFSVGLLSTFWVTFYSNIWSH